MRELCGEELRAVPPGSSSWQPPGAESGYLADSQEENGASALQPQGTEFCEEVPLGTSEEETDMSPLDS